MAKIRKKLKVLVIGSGGREHAIIWKLLKSRWCGQIFFAPGNGIVGSLGDKVVNVNIKATAIVELLEFALVNDIDLTIVGPEDPLILGIVDKFRAAGLTIFGPTEAAARLEGSKVWMKRLCEKYGIPTAPFAVFDDFDKALAYVNEHGVPIVIKADGPALGKGAYVCQKPEEAEAALREIMVDRKFGDSGNLVVIEDCLKGSEASMMAICCGTTALNLLPSRDHKPIFEDDHEGPNPNTGGMGAYTPLSDLDEATRSQIQQTIVERLLAAMEKEGCPYSGLLYPGIILTEQGPMLLEVNCRPGDPETQVVLPQMKSDLLQILLACAQGSLDGITIKWYSGICIGVVMASKGYPDKPEKGFEITGIEAALRLAGITVFQAGTAYRDGKLITSGGRVLCVVARRRTAKSAFQRVYEAVNLINFEGEQYRTDIGSQALEAA